jgi:hypothetical protein
MGNAVAATSSSVFIGGAFYDSMPIGSLTATAVTPVTPPHADGFVAKFDARESFALVCHCYCLLWGGRF